MYLFCLYRYTFGSTQPLEKVGPNPPVGRGGLRGFTPVKGGFFVLFIKESMSYNPIPPRVWSRVQGQCNHDINIPSIEKGNVLQYKKNSSNLTKQQKYSQIAKGYWTSRRKCFASQTQTYTNPNTASFKRVNSINIPFPNNIVGAPNNISGPFQYDVPNPFGCPTTVLEDGGTLLGTTYVNPCTNAVIRKTYVQNCNPTSASDVPGPIETLCWDPSVATWYPRQRLNMSNSSDKWPVGYKGFVSAITPIPPVLYYDSCQSTLYWTYEYCLPVSSVNIYKDGQFYKVVPAPLTSTPLNDLVPGQTYTFTAKSVLYGTESEVSNSVTVTPINPVEISYSTQYNIDSNNGFTTYTFNVAGTGTIRFNCQTQNIDITVVGGGGGGAGSGQYVNTTYLKTSGGGGGGNGAVITMTGCDLSLNNIYVIEVGGGGVGGLQLNAGNNGASSAFESNISLGGYGGSVVMLDTTSDPPPIPVYSGGASGLPTVADTYSASIVNVSYNNNQTGYGGKGHGSYSKSGTTTTYGATDGSNNYVTNYNNLPSITPVSINYGGGGGGGGIASGGKAGISGDGGDLGSNVNGNGEIATTPGSGGGGASESTASIGYNGGAGAPGILIIKVPNI